MERRKNRNKGNLCVAEIMSAENFVSPKFCPPKFGKIRRKYLRQSFSAEILSAEIFGFSCSFIPDTSKSWNHLCSFIESFPHLYVFKKQFMEFFNIIPTYIILGTRSKAVTIISFIRTSIIRLSDMLNDRICIINSKLPRHVSNI